MLAEETIEKQTEPILPMIEVNKSEIIPKVEEAPLAIIEPIKSRSLVRVVTHRLDSRLRPQLIGIKKIDINRNE